MSLKPEFAPDADPAATEIFDATTNASWTKRVAEIAAHIADRRMMALSLYEPLPFQERFHKSNAKEVVLKKGNQCGGSLAGFVEVARAALGMDPHNKYPKTDGVICCLGYGESHIGNVVYPYLCMAGKFMIIRDEVTNEWRTYRPLTDLHRVAEAKKAPPLIPPRYIKQISWNNKAKRIFDRIDLTTGWTIKAFNTSGLASHAQGFTATLIHIDEDTDNPGWYDEMIARLSMSKTLYGVPGRLRWTAMPHSKNQDLTQLLERCEEYSAESEAQSVCIGATVFDNPYIPEDTRKENIRIWKSQGDDVYRRRALGEMVTASYLMYPTFSRDTHNVRTPHTPEPKAVEVLRQAKWTIPADWCQYAVIDPGHTLCAITYWAVPPPELGDLKLCYAESYIDDSTVTKFGDAMQAMLRDATVQEFIIDSHGGNISDFITGKTPREHYTAELRKRRLESVGTGHGFRNACTDIQGRQLALREWLGVRRDGTTQFLIDVERCPNTVKEFIRYRRKTGMLHGAEIILDEGNKRSIHALDTVEYAAAHGLPYIKPPSSRSKSYDAFDAMLAARNERLERQRLRNGPRNMTITLGPVGVK